MRKKITHLFSIITAMTLVGFSAGARDGATPATKDVTVNVGDVFVPGGFDSSSDVYVIASGVFPNGCYKWKEATVTHKSATEHEVRSLATVSSGMCLMVLVPFSKEIRIGKLEAGNHILRFNNDDGTFLEKTITIE